MPLTIKSTTLDTDMSQEIFDEWKTSTVIEEEDLQEYVFSVDEEKSENIELKNYCIETGGGTIATDAFIKFLREKFPFFVFPEKEVEDMGYMAYRRAQEQAGHDSDYKSAGLPGELILFLFVEGILEMPLVCHKLAIRESTSGEQKGSDGIFYGTYENDECLGLGEAKCYQDRKAAIRNSLDSTSRFYGIGGDEFRWNEIHVAARNIERTNLNKEQIKDLSEKLVTTPQEFKNIHPIFIGYSEEELENFEIDAGNSKVLKDQLLEYIEEDQIFSYIENKVEEYSDLKKHQLIFIMLPVEDATKFKKRVMRSIYGPEG